MEFDLGPLWGVLDIGNEYKKVLANLSNVGNFASVRLKLQLDFNKFWNYFEFIEQKKWVFWESCWSLGLDLIVTFVIQLRFVDLSKEDGKLSLVLFATKRTKVKKNSIPIIIPIQNGASQQ